MLELLQAKRRLRSIRYHLSQDKLAMAKDLDSFDFKRSPINEEQIRHLYQGSFVSDYRNLAFNGGTWTDETRLVDLANDLEQEKLEGLSGKLAEKLARMDLVVLDELGYLPFSKNGGQLIFHLVPNFYGAHLSSSPPIWPLGSGPRSSIAPR